MKNFLKKITHDPYTDWFLMVIILTASVLFLAVWSYFEYRSVNASLQKTDSPEVVSEKLFNIKDIESLVQKFENKIQSGETPHPSVDVRDPSL